LASLTISGKSRVTSPSGTMTLRGSVLPEMAYAEKLSHASKRIPAVAIDNAVCRPGRDPPPMSPQSLAFWQGMTFSVHLGHEGTRRGELGTDRIGGLAECDGGGIVLPCL